MNHTAPFRISLVLLALMLAASAYALRVLPSDARIAIHFDMHGTPDRFAPPLVALLLIPLAALLAIVIFRLAPRWEPRKAGFEASGRAYGAIWTAVLVVLTAAHALIVAHALGLEPDVGRGVSAAIGLLFLAIGNMAGKIRPNATLGVRTPWTLADDRVWTRTHRLFGVLFIAAGVLLLLLAGFGAPGEILVAAIAGAALFLGLGSFLYSLWLYRRLRRSA